MYFVILSTHPHYNHSIKTEEGLMKEEKMCQKIFKGEFIKMENMLP